MGNSKKIYGDKHHLEIFCATYLADFCMIEAASSVGISLSCAYKYMHDPDIKRELARLTEARLHDARITVERILRELSNAAFLDIAELVDKDGVVHGNVHDIPEAARRTITEIEQSVEKYKFDESAEIEFDGSGAMVAKCEMRIVRTKVKCMSKERTLELLGKYRELAMFKDVIETNATDEVARVRTSSLEDRVAGLEKDRVASMLKPQ